MSQKTWRKRLVDRFPDLFRSAAGYPFVEDGWRDLVTVAVERIDARGRPGPFWIERIEEKYGALVLDVQRSGPVDANALEAVRDAISLAEARSSCTCQVCGGGGVLYDDRGWFATLCADHARGTPVEFEPALRNLDIIRIYVGGRLRLARTRRYDRATDGFIDIDPRTLGLEEDD